MSNTAAEGFPSEMVRLDHGLSAELVQAIGEFTVNFAQLEWALKFGIQTLLTCDTTQKGIVTADQNFSRLVELLNSLYPHSSNKRVPTERIDGLCKAIEEVRSFRNRLMHSTLAVVDDRTLELQKTTIRPSNKGLKRRHQEINVDEIQQMSDRTQLIAGELTGIFMGYHQISPPVI